MKVPNIGWGGINITWVYPLAHTLGERDCMLVAKYGTKKQRADALSGARNVREVAREIREQN